MTHPSPSHHRLTWALALFALLFVPQPLPAHTPLRKNPQPPKKSSPHAKPTPTSPKHPSPKKTTRHALTTHFEQSLGTETISPKETMDFYRKLAAKSPFVRIVKIGQGDSGHPIHAVIASKQKIFSPNKITNQVVVLVNNGIHSGESCGIDATQLMLRHTLLQMSHSSRYDRVIFVTIPIYNVGGHRTFSTHNRANQNGPVKMGFRANARNYDLNRDFVKTDTANMKAFARLFHRWRPHLFIDNHSTNGADYQHALTYLISAGPDLPPSMRRLVNTHLRPHLERQMAKKGYPLCPYVMLKKAGDIRKGLKGAMMPARFSTGYTRLFNTIAILSESHMLKPYKIRVYATLELMKTMLSYASRFAPALRASRQKADTELRKQKSYTLRWKRTSRSRKILFLGYAYHKSMSPITGAPILRYDRNKPRRWMLPYYDHYRPTHTIKIPKAYLIPPAWTRVIARLQLNQVKMRALQHPQTMRVEELMVTQISWSKRPYEGHFAIEELKIEPRQVTRTFPKGTWLVPTAQKARRYILEALEPMGWDSFLAWNFFDTIFQQKEYFNSYLFEPKARELLRKDKRLRQIFENRLRKEPDFAKSPFRRLQFIYQSSKYYEKGHNIYPVVRLLNPPIKKTSKVSP